MRQPELAPPTHHLELEGLRVKARVGRSVRHLRALRVARGAHLAAVQAARDVNPAVEPERGVAGADLRGARGAEAREDHGALLRDAIAVVR